MSTSSARPGNVCRCDPVASGPLSTGWTVHLITWQNGQAHRRTVNTLQTHSQFLPNSLHTLMHTVHTEMRGWMLLVKVEPKPKIKQKETAPVESGAALGRKKAVGYALSERLTSRLENVWTFSASCALVTWTFDSRAPTQCQSTGSQSL